MTLSTEAAGSSLATSILTSSTANKNDVTDLGSIPSFAQILNSSLAQPSVQRATEVMTDFEIKALTQSGKTPQEVADAFIKAGATIYDIARATGSSVDNLRKLADELGMDYIDPYKNTPALASAMDKMSDNAGGFVRIGVDENGQFHLQTAGSGGIFGWQNMDQIRMSDNSLPNLVQTPNDGRLGLFRQDMLSQQEIDALTPFLPQARDTTVKYTTGGNPTAWSIQEWNAGKVQMAYNAMQNEPDNYGIDQKA
ncbi:MAG: hypothetical protein KKH74_02730 [Gammaproteobacteria bacterium]|nr:hypothetical protein [Gammaproteobacteria bacterium]MBU1732906.1 hypothetical protein [Gammaproteobacteria bacterium]MBU1891954.1 hypothetical protein [Gammaproteobacteria bacterium]